MSNLPDYFAGAIADTYDKDVENELADPAVHRLAEMAQGGPCLEFAIGTGRIALPLQARGLRVDGIEYSADMLNVLRAKPGGEQMHLRQGDMATADMGQQYALVFLVFNTIMNLTTQTSQTQCFRNAARHLRTGGHFVVEVMVPDLRRYPPGAVAVPFDVTNTHLGFDTYETAIQKLTSHHVRVSADGHADYTSIPFRYVWPAELDLMAEIAGMQLVSRHADWQGTPFDDNSRKHVSVWMKN
jgi:SAM-dependent methyltransferase